MWICKVWIFVSLMAVARQTTAQRGRTPSPCGGVYLMAGLFEDGNFMTVIAKRIQEDYPKMDIFISDAYPDLASLLNPLFRQIRGDVRRDLLSFCRKHPAGIAAIGHSQGALILRAYMEIFPDHCIRSFISLAGVHRGQYGIPGFISELVPFLQIPLLLNLGTFLFYQPVAQEITSVPNYWNDPHHFQEYLTRNFFLPVVNGENPAKFNESFKVGFLKVDRMVTCCSPKDAILVPWQTCQYEFFDENENIFPYQESVIYRDDTFGLRTLDESGRWIRFIFRDVEHFEFLFNERVYALAIRPHLTCAAATGRG